MFKVLIADDEPSIREGLRTLIPWEQYGFRIIGTAFDGKDALVQHELLSPDLMIVDIRMPGMDGLELIGKIKETGSLCHFLILSGYSDFKFAQKAIGYKVDEYILKPVEESELCGYLMRLKPILQNEAEDQSSREADKEQRSRSLIESVINGGTGEAFLYEDEAARLGLIRPTYQVLLLELRSVRRIDARTTTAICRNLDDALCESLHGIPFPAEHRIGILFGEVGRSIHRLQSIHALLSVEIRKFGFKFIAALGDAVKRFEEIGQSYRAAEELLNDQFIFAGDRIISKDMLPGTAAASTEPVRIEDHAEKLFFALDVRNGDSVKRLVYEFGAKLILHSRSEQSIKTMFSRYVSLALSKLSGSNPAVLPIVQDCANAVADIYSQPALPALQQHVCEMLLDLMNRLGVGDKDTILKQMMDLVHRNYNKHLKLETLAEVFSYNSGYLGKMFKIHTGDYFNTYVDKIRIEKAKELLLKGMKVHQVSEMVGYANADYFHSKFKKYSGVSPSSFRGMKENIHH